MRVIPSGTMNPVPGKAKIVIHPQKVSKEYFILFKIR
jgi:hypothetical protein